MNIHGKSGFLAAVGDVDQMAQYATDILKEESSLLKYKKGAYEQAQNFDIKAIVPMYENVYAIAKKNSDKLCTD